MAKGSKSISIWEDDYARITALQTKLGKEWSEQLGTDKQVSQAEVVNLALTFFIQRRDFDKGEAAK